MTTRREKVLLELEDHFTSGMVKAAAATKLLDKELGSLSGSSVQTSRDSDKAAQSIKGVGTEAEKSSTALRRGTADINQFSGRLRLITEAATLLGPALVPIGAVAVPAVVALAGGLAAAASAAGIAVLAFNGVGDALSALDAYQLDPSTAHLEKMREEFEKLGPTGVEFVRFLDSLEPELKALQDLARQGLFPGVEDGIRSLMTMLPQVRVIVFDLATELGSLADSAGDALSGDRFAGFFDYLETDAAPTLSAFARTLGNVGEGLASLMVAFAPLSRDFSSGMEAMSRSFADWSAGLSETDGFRSFVAYVRESGPQVMALLGSLATAFVDIAVAAAPVGNAVLPALTALSKVLSAIASSPIGPPLFTGAAAMLALARATKITNSAMMTFSGTTAAGAANIAKLKAGLNFAVILAGIWAVDKAMDKVFGDRSVDSDNLLANLSNLKTDDAAGELDKIGTSIMNINSSMGQATDKVFGFLPGDTTWSEARDNIEKVDQALAQMVNNGNAEQAAAAMDSIVASAKEQGISAAETTKWFKGYQAALDGVASSADGATDSQLAQIDAADAAAAATKRKTQADNVQSRIAKQASAAIDGLVDSMQEQTSAALGAFDAVTQYNRALDDAQAQAKKSNAGINASTEAGRKNRDALSSLAGAWNNQSDAIKNNEGKWRSARAQFMAVADQMGVNEDRARKLANSLMEIPKSVITRIEARNDPALRAIAQVKREMATLKDKSVTLTYYVNQVNRANKLPNIPLPGQPSAFGNFNAGDVANRHQPALSRMPQTRIWNEPETGGESYIPHANDSRRPRAKSILESTANMFGGSVAWHAGGGFYASTKEQRGTLGMWQLASAVGEASVMLQSLNKVGLKEIKARDNILDRQIKQAEKTLQIEKDRVEEEKQTLNDLKAARKDFADSVAANFKTSLFGESDLAKSAADGLLGADFKSQLDAYRQQQEAADLARVRAEQQRLIDAGEDPTTVQMPDHKSTAEWTQQFLDTLSQAQLQQLQVTANSNQLEKDTTQAGAFAYLLKQLREMGLKGNAYRELASSGNLGQAQAYANLTPEEIAKLMRQYREQEKALSHLGGRAGDAEFGRQIKQQTKAVERQADLTEEARDLLKSLHQAQKRVEVRQAELNKIAARLAKDTGKAVGDEINGAVTHGQQKARA